jgi:hypothetical protein
MRRWTAAILPTLLGAGWLLSLFGRLLSPERALANRDIAVFHLPLRSSFRDLARFGLPVWNPWLHGGQPILSNPSYGAFYPPSWLVLAVRPEYALSLMVWLHAVIAFAGAWRLARHFGCGRGAAALASVGYVGCGSYLSLLSAYTLFGSMAWFPWVVAWGDEALRAEADRHWWRPALLCGGALGMQLLNGEPSTVVISGLALLALAASAGVRRPAAALRVLLPVFFSVALAAVQLLPTLDRLADSPRGKLSAQVATVWSMRPERLIEVLFPRFFGDPALLQEGLFLGWKLNDRDYPYVESLYPGLLLAVLGVSALLRSRVPRRASWALSFAAGCFLALGRHNPLYASLRETIPVLAVLRYPEKFAVLAILALALAGVLGWQRLLDERGAGRGEAAALPLAVALSVMAIALGLALLLLWDPGAAGRLVTSQGAPHLNPAGRAAAVHYLQRESWTAVGTAAAVAGLLALCRWRHPSRRLLESLAVLLLAMDLWRYNHGLLRTLPASMYRDPPPLASALLPAENRIFTEEAARGSRDLIWSGGEPESRIAYTYVARLDPYAGLLWGIPYAFDVDFDMMLTRWAQESEAILRAEAARPPMAYRYLGAWNVGTLLRSLTAEEQAQALKNAEATPKKAITNAAVLPRFRFLPRVTFHPSHAVALAAARSGGWRVARHDHCVRSERPAETLSYRRPPRLLEVRDEGERIELRYRAAGGAFLVAAMTYDRGWRAVLDGKPVPTHPTAACQLGVALPPGEHRLVLRFREPLLGVGTAVSLVAAVVGAAALLVSGRRRRIA